MCGGVVVPTPSKTPKGVDCTGCGEALNYGWRDCTEGIGCRHHIDERIINFGKGDIVVWHADMPHATQAIAKDSFVRYAFTVRFTESKAILCNLRISCGSWLPCCSKARLQNDLPGEAHGPCFPQVYPTVLEEEYKAHFAPISKPLIARPEQEALLHDVPIGRECW